MQNYIIKTFKYIYLKKMQLNFKCSKIVIQNLLFSHQFYFYFTYFIRKLVLFALLIYINCSKSENSKFCDLLLANSAHNTHLYPITQLI